MWERSDDPTRLSVTIAPILTEPQFSCTAVNECSGRGVCARLNEWYGIVGLVSLTACSLCEAGWGGDDCSTPACRQAFECGFQGDCIAPNTCACREGQSRHIRLLDLTRSAVGWLPPYCLRANCSSVNDCSGSRGSCLAPGICQCQPQFSGASCELCGTNYFGDGTTCTRWYCRPSQHCPFTLQCRPIGRSDALLSVPPASMVLAAPRDSASATMRPTPARSVTSALSLWATLALHAPPARPWTRWIQALGTPSRT